MELEKSVLVRLKMFGGKPADSEVLAYIVKKSLQSAMDFCSVHEFPDEAETYLVDWIVSDYLTETDGYSKQWERIRKDAEIGLINFRRMRW